MLFDSVLVRRTKLQVFYMIKLQCTLIVPLKNACIVEAKISQSSALANIECLVIDFNLKHTEASGRICIVVRLFSWMTFPFKTCSNWSGRNSGKVSCQALKMTLLSMNFSWKILPGFGNG